MTLSVAGHVVVGIERQTSRRCGVTGGRAGGHIGHASRGDVPTVDALGLRVDVASSGAQEIAGGAGAKDARGAVRVSASTLVWLGNRELRKFQLVDAHRVVGRVGDNR